MFLNFVEEAALGVIGFAFLFMLLVTYRQFALPIIQNIFIIIGLGIASSVLSLLAEIFLSTDFTLSFVRAWLMLGLGMVICSNLLREQPRKTQALQPLPLHFVECGEKKEDVIGTPLPSNVTPFPLDKREA